MIRRKLISCVNWQGALRAHGRKSKSVKHESVERINDSELLLPKWRCPHGGKHAVERLNIKSYLPLRSIVKTVVLWQATPSRVWHSVHTCARIITAHYPPKFLQVGSSETSSHPGTQNSSEYFTLHSKLLEHPTHLKRGFLNSYHPPPRVFMPSTTSSEIIKEKHTNDTQHSLLHVEYVLFWTRRPENAWKR